jgi:hypothetical protein
MMHFRSWQRGVRLQERQVYLSLLVILLSHLLLMVTPLHDVVVLGHPAPHQTMAAHAAHAATGDCVGLTAGAAHSGYDCAIRGNTPPRSGVGFLLASASVVRPQPSPPVGLLPAPVERSTWPPPIPDLHVLFQVFRI